ncbi:precorrin-6Y C5,15-methyltransferase (decarboxylating) subunit CbiT [Clostridium sp. SM-530-WT-3G]|uniref:precorrin-6Y C5,15-methyltransferase (decarboxylating) subunit CbiT n=1 Tax=Clostridium sp. SM-530-WT-3G TaxID=2725303 RepID=UPI00145E4224|nr:precorrin-6Y C5,15-methyltransferase (decarboxylating) subunit CbiT [Clostridium sp. SM-530-WT-3G]NME81910.1 precorrin-6Y C5,15-methyltransferase (decarboxylating) subunit CbiT [Clostridium sp. SM-530-WT-3G]
MFIKDEEFIRGNCPMTKEEIRILSIGKMNINEDSNVIDIGSGTGSITIQSSKECPKGKVYSIEMDDEAYNVTSQNIDKFKCENIELIKGDGSTALAKLIEQGVKVDSAFIGGNGGQLEDIIKKTDKLLNENGTMVMNFITLDNAYKAIEIMRTMNYKLDIALISVSKNRGKSLMMMALNPIYIVQCIKCSEEE